MDSEGAKAKRSSLGLRETENESPAAMEPYQTSVHQRHRNITEEVKRLMQEQDTFSEGPPVASGRGKKSQVRPQTVSQTSKVI